MTTPAQSAITSPAGSGSACWSVEELLAATERLLLDERQPLPLDLALKLMDLGAEHTLALVGLAHRVRLAYCGPEVELESLLSAKTGGCSEDCAFCSQA